jgi:hypothetical protein
LSPAFGSEAGLLFARSAASHGPCNLALVADASIGSVQVLNKIVLKRARPAAFAALFMLALPSQAQTDRPAGQKPDGAALAATARQTPAAVAPDMAGVRDAYTSADAACTTGRKRLWTETGWIVRRVTSCR